MMLRFWNSFIVFLVVVAVVEASAQDRIDLGSGWKQILPIFSSRAEVERILGPDSKSRHTIYDTEEAAIGIEYSTTPCRSRGSRYWDVPVDTVISYSVGLKRILFVDEVNLKKENFVRSNTSKVGEMVTYSARSGNLSIEAEILENKRELISSLFYRRFGRYAKLSCRK